MTCLLLLIAWCFTYEATYTDASGASCVAFDTHTGHEIDVCEGRFDRN